MAFWWIPPALWMAAALWQSVQARRRREPTGRGQVRAAAKRLYSRRRFLQLGGGVAVAGVFAYSGVDQAVEDWHARSVRSANTDRMSSWLHEYGERFWFFYWAAIAGADEFIASTPLTRHGRSTYESMLLGLPMLWTTQRVLGASRPKEGAHTPHWRFFADDNSASGHAFIAAMPWLTGARQVEPLAAKLACAAAVPWVGWSRMNDHKHYLGQILLGGWIAHLATDAVMESPHPD